MIMGAGILFSALFFVAATNLLQIVPEFVAGARPATNDGLEHGRDRVHGLALRLRGHDPTQEEERPGSVPCQALWPQVL
jgi:hypothetical protein